jgi:ZIP family zinc transporter
MEQILIILAISVLGPIIGSFIGILKIPSEKFMLNMLAFAGGVMLAISFLQLIPESIRLITEHQNSEFYGIIFCVLGVSIGAAILFALDRIIPHVHPEMCIPEPGFKLKRTATFLIIGIFLHNIPEGMAIALGEASEQVSVYVIALAIAIHNIPEGICTSAPYYHSSKQRLKSFLLSASTAIPILVGFLIAFVLYRHISDTIVGLITGVTAGLMIYITADEIIPTSCSKEIDHKTIFSLIVGIIFVILLGLIQT